MVDSVLILKASMSCDLPKIDAQTPIGPLQLRIVCSTDIRSLAAVRDPLPSAELF